MKRAYAAALCLCLLLTACGQGSHLPPDQTTAGTQSHETQTAASDAAAQQQTPPPGDPALYFSGELPDPQSMAPTYEAGTLTFEGTLSCDIIIPSCALLVNNRSRREVPALRPV